MSPSSQRAWIEITLKKNLLKKQYVALLAEGVDRNRHTVSGLACRTSSPSSRRAWIEITTPTRCSWPCSVALLAEGVDRNNTFLRAICEQVGRPPRGGRG